MFEENSMPTGGISVLYKWQLSQKGTVSYRHTSSNGCLLITFPYNFHKNAGTQQEIFFDLDLVEILH